MDDGVVNNVEESKKAYNIRHRCFHFSKEVIGFVRIAKVDRVFFSLYEQLVRSATSIGANVVEGGAGSSKKDFVNFLTIALKSANETKYWLCLVRDTMEEDKNLLNKLISEADALSKIIARIVLNAKH